MTSIIYWSSFVTSRPTIHSSASELFRAARSGYSSQTGSLWHSNLYFCANFVRSSTITAPYCSSSPRRRRRNAGERGAPIVTTERQGLPKPWHPDPIQVLTAAPAPAPDMTSEAVLAAQPKVEPAPVAKSDAAPKKKRVTRRQPPDQYRQSYGWSREPFGGFFGRF
jgi:hypothetical protein